MIVGCGGAASDGTTPTTPTPVTPAAVATVDITSSATSLAAADSLALSATLRSASGAVLSGRTVTWSSSATDIASVSSTGVVKGVKPGSVVISATSEGKAGSLPLTVTPAALRTITLAVSDSSFKFDEGRQVTATLTDATGATVTGRTITWSVAGSEGATIASTGLVRAAHAGPLTVTATVDGVKSSVDLSAYRPGFVTRLGTKFMLNGKPFFFGGTNSYWALLEPQRATRDAMFQTIGQSDARVVRVWGSYERGSADGSVRSVSPTNNGGGAALQIWDVASGRPVVQEGPNGLDRLDQMVAAAAANGQRVIISLVDNWPAGGGMDQYVVWYGGQYHDEFYTDARMKQAYRDYARAILTRTNRITGIRYADDSTIFAWELANEPGCSAQTQGLAGRQGCSSANTIEPWMTEMSAYLKSIDATHMVATGELGSMSRPRDPALGAMFSAPQWPNFEVTVRMPNIDFGTYHLYPFGADPQSTLSRMDWAVRAVGEFQKVAAAANKPAILEEFGATTNDQAASVINTLLPAVQDAGAGGFLLYQSGVTKWCSPACADSFEIFPATPAFSALKTWIDRFNARMK